ncbi:ABC transporter permease [Gracilibacillus sp. S3-1-1]|uniref:ABC transporter permease n=1 Tax=Gracilibacillus pellucidus TaxID=3095368 RepID=A0ACC6M416_9BACI|nr:ABC transporter permease [Gracilibacillus sp. S3-1-1]MDX8045700.1 ABC transporter permease [Gracilibacillus sp. S3-1-1]
MNKFGIVFAHTYLSKIKSKSFIITTAIILAMLVVFANIQTIINMFDDEDALDKVVVVTEQEDIYHQLQSTMEEEAELVSSSGTLEDAQEVVRDGDAIAALEITEADGLPAATYYSNDYSNQFIQNMLENELQQIKVAIAASQSGIEQETIASIYEPVSFENELIPAVDGETSNVKSEEELSGARGLVYIILFLLYIGVITYGNMIASDIANEKTSRVMEILISSSSPVSQMFAKILGIGLAGLTQMVLFLGVGFILIKQKQDELVGGFFDVFGLSDVSALTFVYAVIFFLLGYFLYATLSAMLGSLVSRTEDVQQLMTPVIFLVVAAFIISMMGISMPDTPLVVISSFIPFFAPMTMFLRVGLLDIPFWEVGLSIAILITTIAILAIIGAKIYRGGVLMYGSSTSFKDIKRALQLSKKE